MFTDRDPWPPRRARCSGPPVGAGWWPSSVSWTGGPRPAPAIAHRPTRPDPRRAAHPARRLPRCGCAALYVLHQPVVVSVAYAVVGWSVPAPVKYVLIVLASFTVTVGLYDLLRRTRPSRFLLGMR
ncbi:hypothetical protein NKG05_06330 [Oerskovia sp. M15]